MEELLPGLMRWICILWLSLDAEVEASGAGVVVLTTISFLARSRGHGRTFRVRA